MMLLKLTYFIYQQLCPRQLFLYRLESCAFAYLNVIS